MVIPIPIEVAEILLMRFYCHDKFRHFTAPNYVRPIADSAEVAWIQKSKTSIQIYPRGKKLTELTRDQIELFEPHVPKINRIFAFFKPIFEPGLSLNELKMLSRIGIFVAPVEKL